MVLRGKTSTSPVEAFDVLACSKSNSVVKELDIADAVHTTLNAINPTLNLANVCLPKVLTYSLLKFLKIKKIKTVWHFLGSSF